MMLLRSLVKVIMDRYGNKPVNAIEIKLYRVFIPPATKLGGVYWNHPVRLSVCPSVRPSVCRHAVR